MYKGNNGKKANHRVLVFQNTREQAHKSEARTISSLILYNLKPRGYINEYYSWPLLGYISRVLACWVGGLRSIPDQYKSLTLELTHTQSCTQHLQDKVGNEVQFHLQCAIGCASHYHCLRCQVSSRSVTTVALSLLWVKLADWLVSKCRW